MVWLAAIGTFLLGALPVAAATYAVHHFRPDSPPDWSLFKFFTANMRGSFFAGFLTIGGFMLSLKTFVLVKMKEGLYDSDAYRKRAAKMRRLGSEQPLYAPLKRLSHLLFSSILAALLTSAMQLTVGLFDRWWTATVCLSAAAGTVVMLVVSLFQIKANLDSWFAALDEEHEAEVAEQQREAK